LFRLAKNTRII